MPFRLAAIRHSLRLLRKSPGFAATAILTIALGVGATTSIFTLVYQVMLRSMPVSHPEQLYKIGKTISCCLSAGLQDDWNMFSYDLYRYLRDHTALADGIAAVQAGETTVSARRQGDTSPAQSLQIRFVSGNYFSVLGVTAHAGRLLSPTDNRDGVPPGIVISYRVWRTKFGSDPQLVGSTLLFNGHPVTVVGISGEKFIGERNMADPAGVWLALAQEPSFEPDRKFLAFPSINWLDLLIRVPDPKTVTQVQVEIRTELRQWISINRGLFPAVKEKDFERQTTELAEAGGGINYLRDRYEHSLNLLMLVAAFVVLIACANLANLMLVRGMARRQEFAMRTALGASRVRILGQILLETFTVAIFGGAAALFVAYWSTRAILSLAMRGVEVSPISPTPSFPVLAFALGVSLLTGLLFGFGPAWVASRSNPNHGLRGADRSTRDARAVPQQLLVVSQVALSFVLLSTAGLLVVSLHRLEHQDFHFEPHKRLLLFIDLQSARYKPDRLPELYRRFDDTFLNVPGVESFAYATYGPMTDNNWMGDVFFPGVPADPHHETAASYTAVSSGYLQTMGIPLLQGRGISAQDTANSRHIAVVNESFVTSYLKNKQPLGTYFGPSPRIPNEFEIVGVTADTKYGDPSEPVQPMYLTPVSQTTVYRDAQDITQEGFKHYASNLIVRYQGDENRIISSLRQALKSIDPEIPIFRVRSYEDQLGYNFVQQELVVRLTTIFGLLALTLASIGLYGVMAYVVTQRTSEIGIRMAVGAGRGRVLTMILRTAIMQIVIGLVIGLPIAFAVGHILQHTLYQTSGFQPVLLVCITMTLICAALIASAIPAQRAVSVDPLRALRSE